MTPHHTAAPVRTACATGDSVAPQGPVRLGVDLGTGNIVLAAVDGTDAPIAGASVHSTVVRDGVVVDWLGAVKAVRGLKEVVEARLGVRFDEAAVAVPPGIDAGTTKVFTNVLEACGLEVRRGRRRARRRGHGARRADGAVIDVGHGTTGVSVLRDGVVASIDEATGGHHMTSGDRRRARDGLRVG
jgi:ethanolamine utilization protein EutJ